MKVVANPHGPFIGNSEVSPKTALCRMASKLRFFDREGGDGSLFQTTLPDLYHPYLATQSPFGCNARLWNFTSSMKAAESATVTQN